MQTKRIRKQRRKDLNARNFPSEAWFERQLNLRGIETGYERNYCLERRYYGDFVWVSKRFVVEIDGSSHEGKSEYDTRRDLFLESKGWTVIRIAFPCRPETLNLFFRDYESKMECYGQVFIKDLSKLPARKMRIQLAKQNNARLLRDLEKRQSLFKRPKVSRSARR